MKIKTATKLNAKDLAYLINLAGEGIPEYLWSAYIEGEESAMDVGARRAARDEGSFSYKNARVIEIDTKVAGMIISYPLDNPYEVGDLNEYPAVVQPLIELEAKAPGSWYINAIATKPAYQGKGIATKLLAEAELTAKKNNITTMSLIVASQNPSAKALYLKLGYKVVASRPVVDFPGSLHGGDWELMIKSTETA